VALGAGGEEALGTNINFLLEQFQIEVVGDSVVRTVYGKYLHPKEALIANGVVNRTVAELALKFGAAANQNDDSSFAKPDHGFAPSPSV
jgi:intraflagellar transport protein 52